MSEIRPPIVVADGLDVSLHRSIEAAALQLEVPDVAQGIYRCYDADGHLLNVTTDGRVIRFQVAEESPVHRVELMELLRGVLDRAHVAVPVNAELDDLIQICSDEGFLYDVNVSQSAPSFFWDWLKGRLKARFSQK